MVTVVKKCDYEIDHESIALQKEREQREAEWIEQEVLDGLRMWHVIFLSIAGVLSVIILLCCCVKFRIPRTKQEIEGDYVRRKILRKFRRRLKGIQNQELDDMDLKKALDKIRAEFKSDNESLIHSDAGFSVGSFSPSGHKHRHFSNHGQIDISLEELRAQSLGVGARVMLAVSRFFGRPRDAKKDSPESPGIVSPTVPPGKLSSSQTGPELGSKTKSVPPPPPKSKSAQSTTAITMSPDPKSSEETKTSIKSSKKPEPVVSSGLKMVNEKPAKLDKDKPILSGGPDAKKLGKGKTEKEKLEKEKNQSKMKTQK